jgi:hypothetical protein
MELRPMSERMVSTLKLLAMPNPFRERIAEKRAEDPENTLYQAADAAHQQTRRYDVSRFCRLYILEQRAHESMARALVESWKRNRRDGNHGR